MQEANKYFRSILGAGEMSLSGLSRYKFESSAYEHVGNVNSKARCLVETGGF